MQWRSLETSGGLFNGRWPDGHNAAANIVIQINTNFYMPIEFYAPKPVFLVNSAPSRGHHEQEYGHRQDVDIAVIRSGFGGSAVACRLAQAAGVAILEQGKEYPTGRGEYDVPAWHLDDPPWHFWVDIGVGMNVVAASGRRRFAALFRHTPAHRQDLQGSALAIPSPQDLDPYYDLAGEMQSEQTQPHPVLGPPIAWRNSSPPPEAAAASASPPCRSRQRPGSRCRRPPACRRRAASIAAVPDRLPPSQSFVGNVNARALLTLNYLAVARANGAKRSIPSIACRACKSAKGSRSTSSFSTIEAKRQIVVQKGVLRAKQVVLAAGTMGSVELLLKSKAGLRGLSDKVGLYFSGNGDFLIPKTVGTPQNLQPTSGPIITAGADFSTKENLIFIEDLGLIPFVEAIMGTRAISVSAADPYQLGYLGMGTDAANGVLKLTDGGRMRLYWDPTDSMGLYTQITDALREMSQQLGGVYAKPETYNPVIGTGLITAHPLGGAVLSETAASGVVDPAGQVHGVPGLFVADGAIIPTALATNPSYTISALAERVAFWMIHGREMTAGDSDRPKNLISRNEAMSDTSQIRLHRRGFGCGRRAAGGNLAKAGFTVLLIEAGGDQDSLNYSVPGFSGLSTEDETYRWDYYVRHYTDQAQQGDPKFVASQDGITLSARRHLGRLHRTRADHRLSFEQRLGRIAEIAATRVEYRRDAAIFQKLEKCEYLRPRRSSTPSMARAADDRKSDSSGLVRTGSFRPRCNIRPRWRARSSAWRRSIRCSIPTPGTSPPKINRAISPFRSPPATTPAAARASSSARSPGSFRTS